jgi:PAS domain S-box-containing protein
MPRTRKHADDFSQQSEWLRVTLNSIGDALISIDAEGRVSALNDAAQSLTRWSQTQALRHPLPNVFRILDEHTRQEAGNPALQALRTGTPVERATHILVAKDGTEHPIDDSAAPIRSAGGHIVVGSVLIFRDVTTRYRAERALHDGEERLRLATSAAQLGQAEANAKFRAIFDQGAHFASLLTVEGVVVDVNRLSVEACGFERSDVIGRPFWECGWWNRSPVVMDLVKSACAGAARGDLFRAETPYFLADGTGRHMLLTITPVTDDEGRTLFLSPIGTDTTEHRASQDALEASVTERLGAEQALRHSQAESERQRRVYEAILTNTPDLAYVFDLDHRFIYANEVLLTMWGRTWAEAIGKTCLELGYEAWHAARHDREIDQVVATRQPVRGEVPFTGTFGRRVYEYIFVPVLGAGGEVEAVAGTTRDVTERKKAEADREALLASERTAREDAERASLVKEEFLAMLSHELRTPLNAIVGWTQVLRREVPTPQTLSQGLAVIDRNARMQAQLIADLLDMSLIMSGKMRIDPERVELRVVVESALESVRASAEAKAITIESVLSPIAAVVNGDPMRLQQVVWNLLSNAIKFTPVGGHVRITLSQVDSHVEITVRDTGKGIGPEFLPHVFERFRQAETSTAREHRGLGLGLAIVKQLIDVHGGRVQVDSDGEGTGSTFTVHLPIARSQGTHDGLGDHSPAVHDLHVHYDPPNLGGVTVLAVDDDPDARDLIGRLLRECGARVVLAGSTSEALTAMEHERLDVIVSDIAMPVRDGYAFMTAVRRMGIRTPAVALSAFARTEDRRRSLQAGFQTHVSKPVEPAELVAIVAALAHKAVAATHSGNG